MATDKIIELKQERARVVTEMRRVHEAAEGENRDFTAEEQSEFDNLAEASKSLNSRIARSEQVREESKIEERYHNALDGAALGLGKDEREAAEVEREYTNAYEKHLRFGGRGLSSDEARILNGGQMEARTDMAAYTTTTGGYAVPKSMADRIFSLQIQQSGIMKTNVTVYRTANGQDLQIPVATAHGAAEWLGEGNPAAKVAETLGQVTLKAYNAVRLTLVSNQLALDSKFDILSFVANVGGQKVARLANLGYIQGTGTTQPTGIEDFSGTGEVETAAAAGPTSDEVMSWFYNLGPQYRQNASFVVSDSLEKVIATLKSTTGQYLWQLSLRDGSPNQLLGKPIYNDPDVEATGTDENVVGYFADWSNAVAIRIVDSIDTVVLRERFADSFQIGVLMSMRTDSSVVDVAALSQLACGAA